MNSQFENQEFLAQIHLADVGDGTLEGRITGVLVQEEDDQGNFVDNTIIEANHKWQIVVNWELAGTALKDDILDLKGSWVVRAYLEGWGQHAHDRDFRGPSTIPLSYGVKPHDYSRLDETIPAWLYSETIVIDNMAEHIHAGAYRLAVTVTYEKQDGTPGPMAGFIEYDNMIQIYRSGS